MQNFNQKYGQLGLSKVFKTGYLTKLDTHLLEDKRLSCGQQELPQQYNFLLFNVEP